MRLTKYILPAFLFLVTAASVVSCAEETPYNYTEKEIESLNAWMKINRPDIEEVKPGLYYKIYPSESNTKPELSELSWVYTTHLGTDLEGNFYVNMYRQIAKRLGTFSYRTHFAPLMDRYNIYNSRLTPAVHEALSNMNIGDSVEIYCISEFAYGNTGYTTTSLPGFNGNISIPSSRPVYKALRFTGYTNNPIEKGLKDVIEYAETKLNKLAADSIKEGLYLKITLPNPEGDTIGVDSSVQIKYAGRFIDDFLFDTNIESVAKEANVYNSKTTYGTIKFRASEEKMVKGFKEAILKMRKGEKATTVFTDAWGYGTEGKTDDSTFIQPFDPLVFEIEVIDDTKE